MSRNGSHRPGTWAVTTAERLASTFCAKAGLTWKAASSRRHLRQREEMSEGDRSEEEEKLAPGGGPGLLGEGNGRVAGDG